jgi:hypothetical protein
MELAISLPIRSVTSSFVARTAWRADRATITYSPITTTNPTRHEGVTTQPKITFCIDWLSFPYTVVRAQSCPHRLGEPSGTTPSISGHADGGAREQ